MRKVIAGLAAMLLAVVASGSVAAAPNSVVAADTDGKAGRYSSIALDASGNPVVAYRATPDLPGTIPGDVRILHCNDPVCAGGDESITSPVTDGDGIYTTMQLDQNGFPVVAFHDQYPHDMRLLHCNDPDCAGGDESVTIASASGDVGIFASLQLDPSGYPVIASHENAFNNNLRLLRCNDENCAGGDEANTLIQVGGNGGVNLRLDSAGLPVIAHVTGGAAVVMRCNDPVCAGGDDPTASFSGHGPMSVALDATGNPVLTFMRSEPVGVVMHVVHCNDLACQGGDETDTVPLSGSGVVPYITGTRASLELNALGYPTVAFTSVGQQPDLAILRCNDVNCAGGDESIAVVDVAGFTGMSPDLTLRSDGTPVVSYEDVSRLDLKVLACGDPACQPDDTDLDGLLDPVDNCVFVANPGQANNDANRAIIMPPYSSDDWTRPNSDSFGDSCDDDDDNDGVLDFEEAGGCNGGASLDPLNNDSDGDLFVDGAECLLGTNPANLASKPGTSPPNTAACGPATDSDGDRLSDRLEVCGYNTDPNDTDSDADLDANPTHGSHAPGKDGCEAASFDNDRLANSIDQLLLAQELLSVLGGGTLHPTFDINKDGAINSSDQLSLAHVISFAKCLG